MNGPPNIEVGDTQSEILKKEKERKKNNKSAFLAQIKHLMRVKAVSETVSDQ